MTLLDQLKTNAASQVAQYPQYANYFNNVDLVVMTKDVRTKSGLIATKGETVLHFKDQDKVLDDGPHKGKLFGCIWSNSLGLTVSVQAKSYKAV